LLLLQATQVVVCCDGTWADRKDLTNIDWIADNCENAGAQRLGYFRGVGTDPHEMVVGGVFGYGLSEQLLAAYHFIQTEWQDDRDQIFIFGFSRGAFAARSLASFIGLVGCLDRARPNLVEQAYHGWYRNARETSAAGRARAQEVAAIVRPHVRPAEVAFLGVFDTVGTLGDSAFFSRNGLVARLQELAGKRPLEDRLHDVTLGGHVRQAYQALAIDEDHEPFEPTLLGNVPAGTVAQEVWFAGGHGEIGSGHLGPEDNRVLAKVPLLWMMEKAVAAGLILAPSAMARLQAEANPLAPQHNAPPRVEPGTSRLLATLGRRGPRTIPRDAVIHPAVLDQRLGKIVELRDINGQLIRTQVYRPSNLPWLSD
jgi:hypothetical protein